MRTRTLGVLIATVVGASPALADRAMDASVAAKEAEQLATAGKYPEAAAKYRAAYALDPKPAHLCNVGVVFQRAKQLPRAQMYLGACLARGTSLDPEFIALVRKALDSVEDKLRAGEFSPLDVIVSPPGASVQLSTFDPGETFIGSRVVWVPFGPVTVSATAEGYTEGTNEVTVATTALTQVRLELVKAPVLVSTTRPAPASRPVPPRQPRSYPAIISTSLTVAVGLGAFVTYFYARKRMDDAKSTTITMDEYDEIVDTARLYQHVSWGLTAAAGIGAVASAYLWYRAIKAPTIEVMPTERGATVSISGRF